MSKFSTTNLSKTRVLPKAFTEKGLYMLATILKSEMQRKPPLPLSKLLPKFGNFHEQWLNWLKSKMKINKNH